VLAQRRRQLAGSMSGGEQQMLAVARALMSSPRILLVDEPSVGLAPILVSRVIGKIKELKEQRQLTVLMAEQNFNQATKIADRGYIIVHGKIEFEGKSTRELRENELVKKSTWADDRGPEIEPLAACRPRPARRRPCPRTGQPPLAIAAPCRGSPPSATRC
jgi:ABC-type branched-subunit amino acid transport system ATPase component